MPRFYPPLDEPPLTGELLAPGVDGPAQRVRPLLSHVWQRAFIALQELLETAVDVASEAVGLLPIVNGGTGAATLQAAGLAVAAGFHVTAIAGGVAGNLTVTGIAIGDRLVSVTRFIGAGVAVINVTDLLTEFTITAANTINNTAGTNTTGDKLLVFWLDLTP